MTDFDTLFADTGRPVLMETLGEAVTYTAPGGGSVSATAIVGPVRVTEQQGEHGRTAIAVRDVLLSAAEVASPSEGGSVTIGAVVWPVLEISHMSATHSVLVVTRNIPTERSKPGYRGRL